MPTPLSLCLYCGSRNGRSPAYAGAAETLGSGLAARGMTLIYGGGGIGLMGIAADAAKSAGGRVVGIIPQFLQDREAGHKGIDEMHVVPSMHERKALMCELADAFCVLPGGLGTLDETFEILTWRQLGLHDKPVFLIDVEGFWQPLIALIEAQVAGGFVSGSDLPGFRVVASVDELFAKLAGLEPDGEVATERL